jgi:hypothetical protein
LNIEPTSVLNRGAVIVIVLTHLALLSGILLLVIVVTRLRVERSSLEALIASHALRLEDTLQIKLRLRSLALGIKSGYLTRFVRDEF